MRILHADQGLTPADRQVIATITPILVILVRHFLPLLFWHKTFLQASISTCRSNCLDSMAVRFCWIFIFYFRDWLWSNYSMQRKLKEDVKNVYSHNNYFFIIQNWHTRFLYKIREGSRLALDDPFWKLIFSLNRAKIWFNSKQNPEYSLKNHSIESRISIELFIQKIEENYSKFQNKAKIWLRSPPEAPV